MVAMVMVVAIGMVWQLPFIGSVIPFSFRGFGILLLLIVAAVGAWLVLRRSRRKE